MSHEFKARCRERFDKLLPVELDATLTVEQKIPTVIASFHEGFADIVNSKVVTRRIMAQMIANVDDSFQFRYNFECLYKSFIFDYFYQPEMIARRHFSAYMKQRFPF